MSLGSGIGDTQTRSQQHPGKAALPERAEGHCLASRRMAASVVGLLAHHLVNPPTKRRDPGRGLAGPKLLE
jgi:hypothetical protein